MLRDILRDTVPNNARIIGGSDPTIMIKHGRTIDSKRPNLMKTAKASLTFYFIGTKPEGPFNR